MFTLICVFDSLLSEDLADGEMDQVEVGGEEFALGAFTGSWGGDDQDYFRLVVHDENKNIKIIKLHKIFYLNLISNEYVFSIV